MSKQALAHGESGRPRGLRSEIIATELGYMWSNMLQRGVLETHRTIGFCAIGESEGSNTLAANMSLFLGSKGQHVALVEAALRTSTLAEVFQATPTPGLAEVLAGKVTLRDAIRAAVASGVDFVPAGEAPDPFWAFTGEAFREVLQKLLVDHALCLVDVPGLNRAPEASLVVRALDAVVLVVEANRHRADVVQRNISYLRSLGTPVLGSVVSELVHEVPAVVERLM
ncbi:MAG: CpsD/CapB family tyrosine-protein kinase [Planctomycetes bacterium]|nr:CpsD/CapB family tyrosine-protein kinase [Planctomycetota bacterium]